MVAILEHMTALSDPTRCRMLLMLEQHELTVSELCSVLQMPQSSVSRHLKTLADDNWITSRRDATSRFYTMPLDDLDSAASRLWPLIREQVGTTSAAAHDDRRLRGVLEKRRLKSQEFFASAAGKWDRLREDLFGDTFYLWAVLGLIDPALTVGDLGCGTGQIAETLAIDPVHNTCRPARQETDGYGERWSVTDRFGRGQGKTGPRIGHSSNQRAATKKRPKAIGPYGRAWS